MPKVPNPVEIVDSVADGAVAVVETPFRVAQNVASELANYAGGTKNNLENIRSQMPKNPMVIPNALIKQVGMTVDAGIGVVEGVARGVTDTLSDVKSQIRRVTG